MDSLARGNTMSELILSIAKCEIRKSNEPIGVLLTKLILNRCTFTNKAIHPDVYKKGKLIYVIHLTKQPISISSSKSNIV